MDFTRVFKSANIAIGAALFISLCEEAPAGVSHEYNDAPGIKHVVLISVDGLHKKDLDWFVNTHTTSTLASLVGSGVKYTNAMTPFPSDSFPGMVGQVTGGNPKTTGIYYDDAYSHDLLPCGCASLAPDATNGAEVGFFENLDIDFSGTLTMDAGQFSGAQLSALYASPNGYIYPLSHYKSPNLHPIFQLSGDPKTLIDKTQLPYEKDGTTRVWPHAYLKVNTIFEVAKKANLRTAWSDKHPAYEILNGPSGAGIDEMFTPEINSVTSTTDPSAPADWTKDNTYTQTYDAFKVQAVINWANGHDHAGKDSYGAPAIYGMNFQSVSTAQKLNTSPYTTGGIEGVSGTGLGGYKANGDPDVVLQGALEFVDAQLGLIKAAVSSDTAIIISAKHGQSPTARADLLIINDGDMTGALDIAWNTHKHVSTGLVDHAMDDDGVLLWLKDTSSEATTFAKNFLLSYNGTGIGSNAAGGTIASVPFTQAGLKKVYAGKEAAKFMGVRGYDGRVPDVIGIAKTGTVFAGGKLSKIAEHGGNALNDRHVALVVWDPTKNRGATVDERVSTVQIAPTILKLLGLNPQDLQAVQIEGTRVLPELSE